MQHNILEQSNFLLLGKNLTGKANLTENLKNFLWLKRKRAPKIPFKHINRLLWFPNSRWCSYFNVYKCTLNGRSPGNVITLSLECLYLHVTLASGANWGLKEVRFSPLVSVPSALKYPTSVGTYKKYMKGCKCAFGKL